MNEGLTFKSYHDFVRSSEESTHHVSARVEHEGKIEKIPHFLATLRTLPKTLVRR